MRDKTGYEIPATILEDWKAADATGHRLLKSLQAIKLEIETGVKERGLIYREVHQGTISDLTNARNSIRLMIPHAVCPYCQGRVRDNCTACRQRGFVSEFFYKRCVPEEVRSIRERYIASLGNTPQDEDFSQPEVPTNVAERTART